MSIGQSEPRIEGRLKVTGQARYVAEHDGSLYPDLLHAVVLGATVAAGRLARVETSAAEAVPGVVAVFTHRNAPRLHPVPIFPLGPAGEGRPPLQDDQVAYAGQAVALVIATTAEAAQHAADLVEPTYDVVAPQTTWALLGGQVAGEALPPALASRFDLSRGAVEPALQAAAFTVELTADTPAHSHSAMELAATVAVPDGEGGLLLHDSTQWVLGCRNAVARSLGLPLERVRVVAPFVGGGFGAKCFTWPHTILAAMATQQLRRPVRLVLSRAQMHLATGCRPAAHQRIALGADSVGRLTAIRQHATSQTSINDVFVRAVGEVSEVLYACANLETRHRVLRVNTSTPTNMRAPGESYGSFALETAMDLLAERSGIDPVELRLRNLPTAHPEDGTPFSTNALRQCLEEGARAFGWAARPAQATRTSDGELVGWGMAAGCYGNYRSQAEVRAAVLADGSVELASATHEIGSGTATLMAQVGAEALGVPVARIRVLLADTDLPAAPVHGASRNAGSIGPAVLAAAGALKARLEALGGEAGDAAALLPRLGLARVEATGRAGPAELGEADFATLASGVNTIRMPTTKRAAMYAFAAHFAEVRVRPELGLVRVTRVVSRCDIGKVINPMLARSQILGGLVFGIGMALSEQMLPDPVTGRLLSAGITDYWLPGMGMMPNFDIGFVGPPDFVSNEVGAKGAGELGTVGSAAAIANAMWHATGRRFQQLPITLDKILGG